MYKNVALILLVFCCAYLLYGYQARQRDWENEEISPAAYSALAQMRNFLPQDVYQNQVLPALREKLADGIMTNKEMNALRKVVPNWGAYALAAAEAETLQDSLSRMWSDTAKGASKMGEELGKGFQKAIDGMSKSLDEALPKKETPSPAPSADAPTKI